MTGTSIDGLDAALVRIEGSGLDMQVQVLNTATESLGKLADPLRRLSTQQPMSAGEIASIAHDFGLLHLQVLKRMIADNKVDLIAIHGQTLFHRPPVSWQLIDPTPVACGLGVPVVYNLRAADLAMGGEGAPITPIADYVLFRSSSEKRAIVNLGGFCNISVIPACGNGSKFHRENLRLIRGKDVCSCNQLLDRIAGAFFQQSYDSGGELAAQGKVLDPLFAQLVRLLNEQTASKRSLGTGDELENWLSGIIERPHGEGGHSCPPPQTGHEIARTACAAIAETIVAACGNVDRLILAGGSVKNGTLVKEIKTRAGVPVDISDSHGIDPQYREASVMAIIGALCQDRIPITLPQVTGVASPPVAGCWIFAG